MTRVLHILDHSLPLHSGYTFRTRAIMAAQAAIGIEAQGITGVRHVDAGPDPETVDELTFHRVASKVCGPPVLREWREVTVLAEGIERVCDQFRPDVLHAHSPALCGLAALKVARWRSLPMVYEIRAFWEDAAVENGTGREGSAKYLLTRLLENHVIAEADHVVAICDGLRSDLIGRGVDPDRVSIMPNGVDLSLFGDAPQRDGALARQLGLGEGPVIGFIGSFYAYEGLDDLISAMPALLECHPDARMLLVGGGAPARLYSRPKPIRWAWLMPFVLPAGSRITRWSAITR